MIKAVEENMQGKSQAGERSDDSWQGKEDSKGVQALMKADFMYLCMYVF